MKFVYAAVAATLIGGTAGWVWPASAQDQGPSPVQEQPRPASQQQGPPPSQEQGPPSAEAQMPAPMQGQGGQHMPMDRPVPVNGTETVCTGVGDRAEQDPRWLTYPVRIEFSNKGAQYLSGAHVDLATGGGRTIASVDCDGAWVLFRVPPGMYRVTARLFAQPGGGTASATFAAPASGQKRVVLDFSLGPNQ
ncbi:MAG: carboxypeptidase-like regulatory domain-containing protein [Rhizomicrobium sp.]